MKLVKNFCLPAAIAACIFSSPGAAAQTSGLFLATWESNPRFLASAAADARPREMGAAATKASAQPQASAQGNDARPCLDAGPPFARHGLKIVQGNRVPAPSWAQADPAVKSRIDEHGFMEVSAQDHICPWGARQKFGQFVKDSYSPLTIIASAAAAGISQAADRYPRFEQGAEGFGRRFGAAMAESESRSFFGTFLFPSLFREDPRYFRQINGSFGKRAGYALSRIVVTRTDSGGRSFNFAKVFGTLASAGLSSAYYREPERTAGKTLSRAGLGLATDAGFNLLEEFVPDLWRKMHHGKAPAK